MLILFAEYFFFDVILSIGSHDAISDKIFLGFLVIPDSMVNDASLKVILAYFGLHLDELCETDGAVDIVPHLFVTFGLEVNEARKVLLFEFVHAVLSQLQAKLPIFHLKLRLSYNPVSFDVECLEIDDLFEVFPDLHKLFEVEVNDHQEIVNI